MPLSACPFTDDATRNALLTDEIHTLKLQLASAEGKNTRYDRALTRLESRIRANIGALQKSETERIVLEEMNSRLQMQQQHQLSRINSENRKNVAELTRMNAEIRQLRMSARDKERERIESEQMYNRLRNDYDIISMEYENLRSQQDHFSVSSSIIGGLAVVFSICIIFLIKRYMHRKIKHESNFQINRKNKSPNMMTLGNFKPKKMDEMIMDIDVSRYTVGQHKNQNCRNKNNIASSINDDNRQSSEDLFGVFEGEETQITNVSHNQIQNIMLRV